MNNEFKGLRHYIDIVESAQQQTDEDAASAGQTLGNIAGGAAGIAALPVRGAVAGAQWLGDKASQAWDAAKQGISNFTGGVAQGAKQGWDATSPQALVGTPAQQGAARPTPGANAGGAGGKWPTTPEEIKAFQKAHPETGSADGIIGIKTYKSLVANGFKPPANFGVTPTVAGGGQQGAAKPTKTPATATPAAPASPAATTQTDDEGNTLVTTASGATGVLGPDGKPLPNGGRVNPAQAPAAGGAAQAGAAKPTAPNPWDGKDPAKAQAWAALSPEQQKWLGGADPTDPNIRYRMPKGAGAGGGAGAATPKRDFEESVGYDEVQRIVSLVHYK